MSSENIYLGKKVFFLHPSPVVENSIVQEMIQQDFEVYVTKEHDRIKRVLQKYPDSVVFIDIDEGISEIEWENWVRVVTGALKELSVGIISAHKSKELIRKYTEEIKIKCGYTIVTQDIGQSTAQVWEHLQRVDAKGPRKHLRLDIDTVDVGGVSASVNIPYKTGFLKGDIKDISVIGLRCAFGNDLGLPKNTLFKDMQIKLQTTILKAEAIIFGSRPHDGGTDYVFLFTQKTDPEVKAKIRIFILQTLQSQMDALMKK